MGGGDSDAFTALVLTAFLTTAAAVGWLLARACVAVLCHPRDTATPTPTPTPTSTPRRTTSVWREVQQPGGERAVACAAFLSV